jgi:hypothetical protein
MDRSKYTWEPFVQDALTASQKTAVGRIYAAEKAITARLNHSHQLDCYEAAALICALETLKALNELRTLTEAPMYRFGVPSLTSSTLN